ncbi:hypothetical protein BGZ75_006485 [Mortierella antarctica]|nr:hypothetical protein BGZ75_006485 [Mortierella antarctica]
MDSMLDQSITVDAEHLMALKHGKRMAPFPEQSVSSPTSFARKIKDDSSDEEEIGFVPHNRGNKLKRRANPITGGCRLFVPDISALDEQEHEIRSNFRRSLAASGMGSSSIPTGGTGLSSRSALASSSNGMRREVIQIRGSTAGRLLEGEDGSGGHAEDMVSEDENPYADIKIGEIFSPLESSTEILQRPQLRKLFKSPQLQIMAVHAMAMIEREKMVNKMMSRVALILQGDDPLYPQLGYGMGEGCSTAMMGMPDQEELVAGNRNWKEKGEDQEQVQKTLSLLMENINCSNQYIDLLSESRDGVNHVSKQKRRLWKKLKEKRERELRRRMLSKGSGNKGAHSNSGQASSMMQQQHQHSQQQQQQHHHRDKHS